MLLPALLTTAALAGARPASPAYPGNCQAPTWSADGSKLTYEVNYHDRKAIELYVYEPGREPRRIQPGGRGASSLTAGFSSASGDSVAHEASWSPAAIDRFVYSAAGSSHDYDLYIDGASALAAAPGADGGPTWSPDPEGRWIAFTSARTGQGDLYLLDVHNVERPPVRLTRDPEASELYAAFSPDGRSLVYVAHTDDGDNLWVIDDVTRPSPRRLTSLSRTQTRPSWSPDGARIAFYSNHEVQDRLDLWVATPAGELTALARGVVPSHDGPAWTPDSRELVVVLDDDARYDPVVRVRIDGASPPRPVATGTVGNGDLDVVRGTDGRTWLALAAQGREGDETRDFKRIYVMPLD